MRIDEDLMEIWPNEVCDTYTLLCKLEHISNRLKVLFEVYTLLLSSYSEYKNIFYSQEYALPFPLPLPGGPYLLCKANGLLFTLQHSVLDLSFFLPLSPSSILVSPDSRVSPFLFHLILYYKTKTSHHLCYSNAP